MDKTKLNFEQRFNLEFAEALSNVVISFQPNAEWQKYSKIGLEFASPMGLGIENEDFEKIAEAKPTSMNCYQFALLNNNLEARSARELGLDLKAYSKLMKLSGVYQKNWKVQTEGMREAIVDMIKAEQGKVVTMTHD